MAETKKIPIMRPLLPEHRYIAPYLEQIDKNRWYTNFGPLVASLEERFEKFLEMEKGTVLSVANGTAGLTNALRAFDLPRGSFCLIPSWTFMATAASAIAAGLVPFFVDVSEKTWALDPEQVKKDIRKVPGRVSAVMVVSPFGSPLNVAAWDKFTADTGIPAILDCAAGFDSVTTTPHAKPGKNPVMISLHATKVLGMGEGGIVVSTDKELIHKMKELVNFGFNGAREIALPGTNGKMSEYSAAVGMAALDLWSIKREVWVRLKIQYKSSFEKTFGANEASPWKMSGKWVSSVCNIKLAKPNATEVLQKLNEKGVESKRWWTNGCHSHPAYSGFQRLPLPVTENLVGSVLGLPFSIDMGTEEIDHVVKTLHGIVNNA